MPFLAFDTHEVPPNVKLDNILIQFSDSNLLFWTRLKNIADDKKYYIVNEDAYLKSNKQNKSELDTDFEISKNLENIKFNVDDK